MAKTSKELWERWKNRKSEILSTDFTNIETKETKEKRIKKGRKSYKYFVKTYFPHLATCECGVFQLIAALIILKNPFIRAVFEWARGHAKSTHFSLLIPLWLKIQEKREINTMVLVSKSEDAAIGLLSDLQAELQFNTLFIKDFGKQISEGHWSSGKFITTDGCMFVALGRGQSPRGLKNRANRVDYISIDDIDDDVIILNEKRVKKATEWCLTALLGAMDMGRGRFILVGNRIGKKTILTNILERPGIYHTKVNTLDKNGNPTWKEKYSMPEITAIREFMGERRFQKEYMNNPITEGAIFKEQNIQFGKMLPLNEYVSILSYTDPSFKDTITSDYKATVLLGKTKEGVFHVLKVYAEQTSVSNMVAWHYCIHDRINGKVPVRYYMEANFIQDLLIDEFRKEGEACGMHIPITGDKRKKPDKFARIEAMQPLFERGLIIFNIDEIHDKGMMVLVEQLLMFERGSRVPDDAPDALEGAIHILNKRNVTTNSSFRSGARPSRRF